MKNFVVKISVFFFVLFGSIACDDRKEIKELQAQTEKIHDDAMKEMAEMNRIGRSLKKDPAFLDTIAPENPRRMEIVQLLKSIQQAENGMMDWMTQYREPAENADKTTAIQYLQEQKKLIEINQKEIHEATEAGKKLVK